jgi:hypothetical protein
MEKPTGPSDEFKWMWREEQRADMLRRIEETRNLARAEVNAAWKVDDQATIEAMRKCLEELDQKEKEINSKP